MRVPLSQRLPGSSVHPGEFGGTKKEVEWARRLAVRTAQALCIPNSTMLLAYPDMAKYHLTSVVGITGSTQMLVWKSFVSRWGLIVIHSLYSVNTDPVNASRGTSLIRQDIAVPISFG